MSKLRKSAAVAAVAAAGLWAGSANAAGLFGSSVSVTLNYPLIGTVQASAGPVTVGSGVEFGPGVIYPGRNFGFDIGNSTISYLPDESVGYGDFGSGGFNGFVLTFTGAPTITGVTYDAGGSTFAPTGISFTGNTVSLDFSGASVLPTSISEVDLTFAGGSVPEPQTWVLMLTGVAAMGSALRFAGRRSLARA